MKSVDYVILIIYLVGIFGVGALLSLKNKNADDMFAAGGESPWWTSGLSAFMTMFSAGTFVVWGGIAYEHGFVAVMINICYGIAALLVGYFVAGKWKKLGVRTPAQFIEYRFGSSAVQFYTWSMLVYRVVGSAVALYALSKILVALMPLEEGNFLRDDVTGNLSLMWAIIIFGGMVVVYTMAGGLWAVLMTDVLQFIVLNLAVLFIIPLILMNDKVGGLSGFADKLPDAFFSLTNDKFTWFFMFGWVMIHFFMVGAEWAFAQRFICVPTAKDARKSTYLFGILYIVSPILWLLPPMVYRVIDPTVNKADAYIKACEFVLPSGMLGLMVAAMFSATASMVSSQLNVFAGVLTDELYRRVFNPKASDKVLLNVGRIFTVLIGVVLVMVALLIPKLGGVEKVIISVTSIMVGPLLAPTLWGLFSKRVGVSAIWITAPFSFILGLVAMLLNPNGFLKTLSGTNNFPALEPLYTRIISFNEPLSSFIASNSKAVELVIGVIVPIVILTVMQLIAKGEAPGVKRVEDLIAETEVKNATGVKKASSMPALIVAGCLFMCSLMMYALLGFNGKEDHLLLVIFGTVLLAISITIFAVEYLQYKKYNLITKEEK
ncbi:sodium:solute symporter family protein [Lentisphaerota bacterium WC36G]|nr:Na+:solute symporter [Lentisphaerae bacterium WC36]